MDGLLIILAIISLISSLGKKKKQQEKKLKQYQRDNAFAAAFPEAAEEAKKPAKEAVRPEKIIKKIPEPVKKAAAPVIKEAAKAVQQELPFTKEDWEKFLGNIEEKKPAEAKPAEAKPAVRTAEAKPSAEGRISLKQPMPEGFSPKLKSTQGESEAEHRRHLERIAAEERLQQEKTATAQELRSMNRQKMRQAVVMSEILGKPVALRGRRR